MRIFIFIFIPTAGPVLIVTTVQEQRIMKLKTRGVRTTLYGEREPSGLT